MKILTFDNRLDLEFALSKSIATFIESAQQEYDDARLLLSGGSTPWGTYNKLSVQQIDWAKVHIGLVDERLVDPNSTDSNEQSLRKVFLDQSNQIKGMLTCHETPEQNMEQVRREYGMFIERTDVVLLGMGNDGHTASLFPGDEVSERLLHSDELGIFYTQAPSHPTKRMTCSKEMLLRAKHLMLLIMGEQKFSILHQAKNSSLPIASFLEAREDLVVYYAP
jgi:6-phosphogluconolactonase